jgi:hypothetical protein
LEWDFKNNNLSVAIKFNIYRAQVNETYVLIASTTKKYYYDTRATPYLTVHYKVESIVLWKDAKLSTGFEETSNYICENNIFKYGRYNNTKQNKKLYQPLNTSCERLGMVGIATTGNLFPNSEVLTQSQIYSALARAKFRPFR